jgi:phosphatidylethanolamine-binding protein (PEBP) family uncharacterized protein
LISQRVGSDFAKTSLIPATVLVVAALVACGQGATHTAAESSRTTGLRGVFSLYSPAVGRTQGLSLAHRCTKGIWLPLRWGPVPEGTKELALYVAGYGKPRPNSRGGIWIPIVSSSLVIGLKSTLHELATGATPRGALEIEDARVPRCPPRVPGERFEVRLFALPRSERMNRSSLRRHGPLELLNEVVAGSTAAGHFEARFVGLVG